MTSTITPPRRRSPGERRVRRERLATWITLAVVAVVCVVVGVGAYAMANSWWVEKAPAPAADQQLADGQSRFDGPGIDFLNRQRQATVDIAAPATAGELGLPTDGVTPIDTLVPLTVDVRGTEGTITFPGVSSFALETAGDRLTAVTVTPGASGAWASIRADLERRAAEWGWSTSDIENLQTQVGEAAREEGQSQTTALPPVTVEAMTVVGSVTVEASGRLTLNYVFTP